MAKRREARTAALYALSREVASATGLQEVLEAIVTQVSHILNAQVVVLLPDAGRLVLRAAQPSTITLTEVERATATWAWQHNQPAGRGADTLPGGDWFYQPLSDSAGHTRGGRPAIRDAGFRAVACPAAAVGCPRR